MGKQFVTESRKERNSAFALESPSRPARVACANRSVNGGEGEISTVLHALLSPDGPAGGVKRKWKGKREKSETKAGNDKDTRKTSDKRGQGRKRPGEATSLSLVSLPPPLFVFIGIWHEYSVHGYVLPISPVTPVASCLLPSFSPFSFS